ncbi:MAG: DUF6504 family protein [Actinomycetota bacterium]
MVRRYDDPVDVRAVADEPGETTPDAFVWRGRLYVVRAVLARWHERRAWWRDPAATALLGLRADEPAGATDVPAALDVPAADVLAADTTVAGECQVWRVEAAAGRSSPVGVYDLVHTRGPGDTWHLARVAD